VGGWGGQIVIPMPEALSFAESRRQKPFLNNVTQFIGACYAHPRARNLHHAEGLINPIELKQNQTYKGYESAPDMKPDPKGGIK
jgi:hypothetical protein